ncbi:hypothetical protein JKF63_05238 [Porcisia hertigi]|uniref:Tubulin tyrosine ligase n=1 Tax=Porcisia hertigi TaxID=2761500 RepID=A0A836ING3_9TRYP|nr:hypothetical protein JKF63_05238 [Porcisia hertigi]
MNGATPHSCVNTYRNQVSSVYKDMIVMESAINTTNGKGPSSKSLGRTESPHGDAPAVAHRTGSDGLSARTVAKRAASPGPNVSVLLNKTTSPPPALERRPKKILSRKVSGSTATLKSTPDASLSSTPKRKKMSAQKPLGSEAKRASSKTAPTLAMIVDTDSVECPGQQQRSGAPSGVVLKDEADLESLHAHSRAGSDDVRGDELDTDLFSATFPVDADGVGSRGVRSRLAAPVTSLAGKRHTKTVMVPGATNGAGAAALTSNGHSSSRRAGTAGGNGGSHHHSDCTLRYRTDLDKQVIHFMFERYHDEQTHPTSSTALSSPPLITDTTDVEGAGGQAGEGPAHPRKSSGPATPTTTAAAGSFPQTRTQRCNVEEVVVPANSEGEDKNIGLGNWHLFWMHVGRVRHTVCSSTFRWQEHHIVNHFPDHAELTRKDLMYKNIKRYLRENQANNYAQLTLYTATDWVSASAGSSTFSSADGAPAEPHRFRSFCFADGVPLTYNIPNDMNMFKEKFQKRRGTQWIVKPTSRSQGKGIFLIDDVRSLERWIGEKKEPDTSAAAFAPGSANRASLVAPSGAQRPRAALSTGAEAAAATASGSGEDLLACPTSPKVNATNTTTFQSTAAGSGGGGSGVAAGSYIVSRYISNPLLIGGKKFDLRLYVLVTSYKPLVAYLHEDGFARFCATRYAGRSLAQEDLGSHLTNVSLQKSDEHYNTSHGGKWSFQNLFLYVQRWYGPYTAEGMVKKIQFLIYHSLKAVEPMVFNDKHCYELYGYDILIDDHINPHLIEVNASPSMSTTTVSDRLLKEQVLTDVLKIILPPGYPASSKRVPYWEYRLRTDVTTQLQTGFTLLQF